MIPMKIYHILTTKSQLQIFLTVVLFLQEISWLKLLILNLSRRL